MTRGGCINFPVFVKRLSCVEHYFVEASKNSWNLFYFTDGPANIPPSVNRFPPPNTAPSSPNNAAHFKDLNRFFLVCRSFASHNFSRLAVLGGLTVAPKT